MRTTLNIDDEVMKFVMEETKASTKTEAVRKALDDYVRRRKIERLIALKGKVRFDVDWKTLRKGWNRKFEVDWKTLGKRRMRNDRSNRVT